MIDLRINVVAFYTDDIPVSGGAESFNGLTGMILQVADMISCAQNKNNEKNHKIIYSVLNVCFSQLLWTKPNKLT